MSEPFYRTYVNDCHRLGLVGAEAMVYSALCFLCHNGAWSGTDEELSDFSCCGSYMTASRSVKSLIRRGIIIKTSEGISFAQNVHDYTQNVHDYTQNVHFLKEKEKNQKNKENNKEINKYNISSSLTREKKEEKATPNVQLLNQLFDMDTLFPADKPKVPANTGYYKIITFEYGYLHPKKFVDEFYNYWDGQAHNETERLVLKRFFELVDERWLVSLLRFIQSFEVTDKLIIFTVPKDKAQDFANWLETLPLKNLLQAYQREIKVRFT